MFIRLKLRGMCVLSDSERCVDSFERTRNLIGIGNHYAAGRQA